MSAPRPGRALWTQVFKNFLNSFRAGKSEWRGNYIGCDLNGNKFFENPADPSRGKRLPRRSFEPAQAMNFDVSNMSAEWDAWLRNRRKDPPTIEELQKNLQIAQIKQENARKLMEKEGIVIGEVKHSQMTDFPQYEEFEVTPGKGRTKFKT